MVLGLQSLLPIKEAQVQSLVRLILHAQLEIL